MLARSQTPKFILTPGTIGTNDVVESACLFHRIALASFFEGGSDASFAFTQANEFSAQLNLAS